MVALVDWLFRLRGTAVLVGPDCEDRWAPQASTIRHLIRNLVRNLPREHEFRGLSQTGRAFAVR